ncbi:MAG: putative Permease [Rhizobiaceae bacterium]|jgi:uncharacterized membrane protein YfcA|nr:putative Permease [Rhizobiaceae bacterium]
MSAFEMMLPPGMEPLVAASLLATSLAASFITIAFGIGGGVLLLAVMASLVPPTALIPVHGAVQFGSNVGRVFFMFRHIAWTHVVPFSIGSLGGVMAGGAIVINLPPAIVQVGVGLFVLWSIFLKPPRWLRQMPLVTGALSSFLTMFFGATGPFVATLTKSLALDRRGHVATHATLMTIQHLLKTIMFGFVGFAFAPWLPLTAAMIGAGAVGTFLGRKVLDRLSDNVFRLALDAILVLLALRLIVQGVFDL